jgi:hypothetical protein
MRQSHWQWILGFAGALAMAGLSGYNLATRATRASGAPEPEPERVEMSRNALNEADTLLRQAGDALAQYDTSWDKALLGQAAGILDEFDQKFGRDKSHDMRERVAVALFHKGLALTRQADHQAALAAFEEMEKRFRDDPNPNVLDMLANSLDLKSQIVESRPTAGKKTTDGIDLEADANWRAANAIRREAKAVRAEAATIARIREAAEPVELDEASLGRLKEAYEMLREIRDSLLRHLNSRDKAKLAEAETMLDALYRKFEQDPAPELRLVFAEALEQKAVELKKLGDEEAAAVARKESYRIAEAARAALKQAKIAREDAAVFAYRKRVAEEKANAAASGVKVKPMQDREASMSGAAFVD